jgi:uncharacterized radical SAM superfamily Fe-S cluster-containing enzyme
MEVFGITQSVCPTCRKIVPARVEFEDDSVFLRKFCSDHGEDRAMIRSGVKEYLHAHRYVKPAQLPNKFAGGDTKPCPEGCGSCSRHEQHLCMPIIEITSRCNMTCPICIADAGRPWDMGLGEFTQILDSLLACESQIDVLNLSGGEPLVHPDLLEIVDEALSREEIVRVSISTNGRRLLDDDGLLEALTSRNVVISLQFDGLDDDVYQTLRGQPLADEKRRILDALEAADIATSLTMTLAGGVNESQLDELVNNLLQRDHVLSLMIQPLAFAGRGAGMKETARRLSIPDVVRLLGDTANPAVRSEDFVPLPCSHPLCFSLAFYLKLDDGGAASIAGMLDAPNLLDAIANRTVFGLDEQEFDRLREMVYDLWSGPVGAAPDGQAVMSTLSGIMREISCRTECFDPRRAFGMAERRIKSIFIHAFQDADTFDLARVRRCCNAYPQADGKLIPACIHNVMGRKPQDTGETQ